MSGTPEWKIFRDGSDGKKEYVAACKYPEDAARLCAGCDGWTVSYNRRVTVWTEGQDPADSFDEAAQIMRDRVREYQFAAYRKSYGKFHPEDPAQHTV